MRKKLIGFLAAVALPALLMGSAVPAAAIGVELAKKCRDMAIKAYPPQLPGTKAYARSERGYFHECIAKNGEMPDNAAANPEPPASPTPPASK